jgi:hypothetical protein
MCFVLDVNSFHRMFDPNSSGYKSFAPLRDWLYDHRSTSLVMGGTRYRAEVDKLHKYFPKLIELKRARKLSEVFDQEVDAEEGRVTALINRKCFDDSHIVGLLCASGCIVFASHDKRADTFVKNRDLYLKGQRRPKIFRNAHCTSILCERNIVKLRNLK